MNIPVRMIYLILNLIYLPLLGMCQLNYLVSFSSVRLVNAPKAVMRG